MYRAIEYFEDLADNRHAYEAGDVFPRDGMEVSDERIEELATDANRRGVPLIEKVEEKPKSATKAQLLAEAEELGIEVPERATKRELESLIEESR